VTYLLRMRQAAERGLRRLPKRDQARVNEQILTLAKQPRPRQSRPLTGGGKGLWRVRVGDWRVVYEIDDDRTIVEIHIVAHRRDVYRGL
jgi:mRNA interferase RelE/StbE